MIARKDSCPRHPTDLGLASGASLIPTFSPEAPSKIVAIPDWDGRVSPVFDVAGKLLVVPIAAGVPQACRHEQLITQDPANRASQLAQCKINILLCGGISIGLREALERVGITVIPSICGRVQGVLRAYLDNRLSDERFAMPGCCAGRPRCQARRRHRPET